MTTKLTKTNSGNYAKQTTIGGQGKWRFCGNFSTRVQAEAHAETHRALGRKVEVVEMETSKSGSKKCHERAVAKAINAAAAKGLRGEALKAIAAAIQPLPVGTVYYRVEAYIASQRQVMVHATAAECAAVGVQPGAMNS